ncbi:MAG: helix-turn-helix transcriptional regulator [Candidatus Heimdallarchaeota archaeon]|nr:MAG: helix-turn-helix transcriptional regulator [Candidatus Heimdallarchaeota archaeon]
MTLEKYKLIFEALDNERRLQLYDHLVKKIFISKSELAKKYDLNRASLNHHLKIMLKAGLIYEQELILDGRRQFFIIPAVILHPDQLVEQKEEYKNLAGQLNGWSTRNITVESWRILRDEIKRQNIPQEVVDAVELRLFPTLGRVPASKEHCYICRIEEARISCYICKNLICQTHEHQIKRDDGEEVILCPNCVEKFFG